MKVTLDAGGGRRIVFEDYESAENLVKVSVVESGSIFVIGTVDVKDIRRLGKAF